MARTVSMENVNLATSSSLFGEDASAPGSDISDMRESIFKLAWSGFSENPTIIERLSGGTYPDEHKAKTPSGTLLTVLGGLLPEDPKGLQVFHLPEFTPPSAILGTLPAQLRDAYTASVKIMYKSIISTDTAPEDFVLLTSDPFYGQSNDPFAIALLLSPDQELPKIAPHTERGFTAYDFPPVPFKSPIELELPVEMHLTGSQAVLHAEAVSLPGFAHKRLRGNQNKTYLPLNGGSGLRTDFLRSGRTQPIHHAILSIHLDMSIRLWDYTTSESSLLDSFSAREALTDLQLGAYLEGRIWIDKVSAAWESTEISLGLSTGEVMVYRFGYAKASAVLEQQEQEQAEHYNPIPAKQQQFTNRSDLDMAAAAQSMAVNEEDMKSFSGGSFFGRRKASKGKEKSARSNPIDSTSTFEIEVSDISAMSDWTKDGFKPILSLSAPSLRGVRISCLSLSEAGFLAVAWNERLAIIDLRGPEVLYSEGSEQGENGGISVLTWTVCSESDGDNDNNNNDEQQPKLLASYNSGTTRIFTLSYTLDTWIVNTSFTSFQHTSLQKPLASFVLDSHGNSSLLTATTLDDCLREQERQSSSLMHAPHSSSTHQSKRLQAILIVVSESSLNVKANLTGERLLKRDFQGSRAVTAKIVRRYGMPVLVVAMQDGKCVIFSLPRCEAIKTMHLNYER